MPAESFDPSFEVVRSPFPQSASTPATQWSRIVALYNPYSSNPHVTQHHLRQLRQYQKHEGSAAPELVPMPTEPDLTGNIELIRSTVGPGDAVIIGGGDGTFSMAAHASLEAGTGSAITTLGGGNANDNAHMLHPRQSLKHAPLFLVNGVEANFAPLQIRAEHPNIPEDQREVLAFAYFSLGFSAEMSERFNEKSFRERVGGMRRPRRFMVEGAETLHTFRQAQPFVLHDERGERPLTELAFPNGSRMAKTIRFAGLSLLEAEAGRLEVGQPTVPRLAWALGRAALGRFEKFGPDKSYTFTANAVGGVIAQADGEAILYPNGTTFTVGLHDKAARVITTRWQYGQQPLAA